MGEPAELGGTQMMASVDFALDVIASVREDRAFPLTGLSEEGKGEVLRMAQTLVYLSGYGWKPAR